MNNEKLARWAGFCERGRSYAGISLWVSPDEIEHFDRVAKKQEGQEYARMPERDTHYKLPNFPESLDLCDKWLMPKVDYCCLVKPEPESSGGQWGCEVNAILKIDVLTHYGTSRLACATCDEGRLACLSLDHIDNSGASHRRSLGKEGMAFYRWIKEQGYPQGYQTLCMNCQWVKQDEVYKSKNE